MNYEYYGTYMNYRSYKPRERVEALRLVIESFCDVLKVKGVPVSCEIIFKEKPQDFFPGHYIDENPDWYGAMQAQNKCDSSVAWKAKYEINGKTEQYKLHEGQVPPALGEV